VRDLAVLTLPVFDVFLLTAALPTLAHLTLLADTLWIRSVFRLRPTFAARPKIVHFALQDSVGVPTTAVPHISAFDASPAA
jgi:hypothetical protein